MSPKSSWAAEKMFGAVVGIPQTSQTDRNFPEMSAAVEALFSGKTSRAPLHSEYRDPLEEECEAFLNARVLGQNESIAKIAKMIAMRLSRFGERDAPLATIYLWGPPGVGKTETAYALAEFFLWDRKGLTRIRGEKYQDQHTSRDLFGAPKSYVGYGEATPLNDNRLFAPRRRAAESGRFHPSISALGNFSILLLDEADKFHPLVAQNFLGVLDHGEFEFPTGSEDDEKLGHSRFTDFRQTVILLTSNAGERERSGLSERHPIGFAHSPKSDAADGEVATKNAIRRIFSPEFLDRIDLHLRYSPISFEIAEGIVRKSLSTFQASIGRKHSHAIAIDVRPKAVRSVAVAAMDPGKGVRNFQRSVDELLIDHIRLILQSGQISGIPDGRGVVIRVDGEVGNIRSWLERSKNFTPPPPPSATETVLGRIQDVAKRIQALQRLHELSIREGLSLETEIVRLETELKNDRVPVSEIKEIRESVRRRVEVQIGGEEFRRAMEAYGDVEPLVEPFPELQEIFYPISVQAIMEIVQEFVRNSENVLHHPQSESLWNGLMLDGIKRACESVLWGRLTKNQHDFIIQAVHRVYLASKAGTRSVGSS